MAQYSVAVNSYSVKWYVDQKTGLLVEHLLYQSLVLWPE